MAVMSRIRNVGLILASITLVAGLAACSPTAAAPSNKPEARSVHPLTGSITVYGAASLTATFTALATEFEAAHPGVTVRTTFNGSSVLVEQIKSGAPADVFASADTVNMTKLVSADLTAGTPVDFATNVLEIAVPTGNPAGIKTFADLAKPGVKTVVCAPAVPCGAATLAVERATGVTLSPVSQETAVTGVLSKVETGQADAGLVYVTDVKGAPGMVDGITFADSSKVVNTYPIAALTGSANPKTARAFVAFVTSSAGQKVLSAAGFGKP